MSSPSQLATDRHNLTLAERLEARFRDAELEALGLPPSGVAAVAPNAESPEARRALADYVLGVIERAGLSAVFRSLLVNDAIASANPELCRLVGAVLVEQATNAGPPEKHWAPPAGMPALAHTEAVARNVAGRLVAKETGRQEGGARE